MGELEIQDSFAPYFDPKTEIGIENAQRTRAKRQPRRKPAASQTAEPGPARPARRHASSGERPETSS
ncbi:hypothetical protein [Arvimicrobium flavum]|uniref:hypothetical protein n=1 Tax=Arvimicrobium flavum TaxID=3393320 RepID=UPI00237BC1FD|nr:hypothetical protein [Mesorhizobium shangrilense]